MKYQDGGRTSNSSDYNEVILQYYEVWDMEWLSRYWKYEVTPLLWHIWWYKGMCK